jgi:RNA polymerase sigma factor (sigma-70 family)
MVMGVCRRLLHHEHDAQDAFQATFLVLARKAGSLANRGLLANWLYVVATKTAQKARALIIKRQMREKMVPIMPEPIATRLESSDELRSVLDLELGRLHARYRIPIILCDLQGKSHKEAAQQLGCPIGTLSGRLTRGRHMLAARIKRRGIVFRSVALTGLLSEAASAASLPTTLISATSKAAALILAGQTATASSLSANVLTLTDGVVKAMMFTKLKVVLSLVLVSSLLAITSAVLAMNSSQPVDDKSYKDKEERQAKPPKKGEADQKRGDKKEQPVLDEGAIHIVPNNRLVIHVLNALPNAPIDGVFQVEASGKIPLGPPYGRVSVIGQTLEEAEETIKKHLSTILREPAVGVTLFDPDGTPTGQGRELGERVKKLEEEVKHLKEAVGRLQRK